MITITQTRYRTNGDTASTQDWLQLADTDHANNLLDRMVHDYAESPDLIAVRRDNTLYVAGVRPDGTRYKMSAYRIEAN